MKSKIAVILLAVFLCLTTGCNNASHIAETPDPISSSDSNIIPSESETAQAEKKTEVDRPQSTESQTGNRVAEFPASVSESDTQTTEVPDQADHSTAVLPQPSEPEKKTDESERRPETAAPTEKEQPTPPATEESKPADQAQPTEPPKQESTEPAFDISYWISFAKSYAESVGLTLNSEAVYCWDNPIDADAGCIYLERDIQSRLNRYGTQKVKLTRGTHDGSTATDYNTDGNGYKTIANATPAGSSGGYISSMKTEAFGRLPVNASGSSSTYEADGMWYNNSQVNYAFVGGNWGSDLLVGPFYAYLSNAASSSASSIGAALSCKPLAAA